jgi:hypothetical protein
LQAVGCRAALIFGEKSALVSRETASYMSSLMGPRAPVVEVPEARHHVMLDQPLGFVAALRMLLDDLAWTVLLLTLCCEICNCGHGTDALVEARVNTPMPIHRRAILKGGLAAIAAAGLPGFAPRATAGDECDSVLGCVHPGR